MLKKKWKTEEQRLYGQKETQPNEAKVSIPVKVLIERKQGRRRRRHSFSHHRTRRTRYRGRFSLRRHFIAAATFVSAVAY